eukprot:9921538-Ditylum_brightwellii.AAC.1
MESSSFNGLLFTPLWDRLREQGEEDMQWRYAKSRWYWFLSPKSKGIKKGREGEDFFTSEESVVRGVLTEVFRLLEQPFAGIEPRIAKFEQILSQALEKNVRFDDMCQVYGQNGRTRLTRRRGKSPSLCQNEKKIESVSCPVQATKEDEKGLIQSQRPKNGAKALVEVHKKTDRMK